MRIILFFFIFLCISSSFGQNYPNNSELKLREIMKGPDFIGHLPENVHWSIDGNFILYDWNPNNNPGSDIFSYDVNREISDEITPDFYNYNADYWGESYSEKYYFSQDGALYMYDSKLKASNLIYRSTDRIRNIQQWPNSNYVYFEEGDQLRAFCKKDQCIETIFVFKEGNKPSETKKEDQFTREEERLFQFIQEQNTASDWREKKQENWHHKIPSFHYGQELVDDVQMSPDGNFLTFKLYSAPSTENTSVQHHISKDGHSYTRNARAKVHDNDPNNRLAVYDFKKDTVYFVDFSTLSDIRKKPKYLKEYGDTASLYSEDRNIVMHRIIYAENSNRNVLDVRSYDNKDRWIVSVDLTSGKIEELEHQHDEAWIGGPGISSWNMASGTLDWLPDGKNFYFQSEETGYSHLYLKNVETGTKKQLTSGSWEVQNVELSQTGKTFYITANKNHPGNQEFYHLSISDQSLSPILTKQGAHEVSVSPDEKWLAVLYSNANTPWEVYIAPNKPNAEMTKITKSTKGEFNSYEWHMPEVITFSASDGVGVNARLYQPEATKKNNAAVIFVHGAGYLQNAHNWWSSYYREYMFHNLLRDNGFTVLDIDFRASAGYGRDFRTAIYRDMGGKDLTDQLDGRQMLIDSLGIDPERIGIYGGSYGGFITLAALLKEPGKFQAGAAIRSVTDWYHYNHEYTSNILNYPSTDSLAYERSSPIYYADNLEDRLLMLHGMVDDNVQFQDVVRLSQRFIELEKTNWELAVFPVEAHGFTKWYSWNDEYRRIYEMFMDELIITR